MNEKQRVGFIPVGVTSLLVIFAVLCLTVFALLSVSTVRADKALSEKSAAAIDGYYRADYAAEHTLALLRTGNQPDEVKKINGAIEYPFIKDDKKDDDEWHFD